MPMNENTPLLGARGPRIMAADPVEHHDDDHDDFLATSYAEINGDDVEADKDKVEEDENGEPYWPARAFVCFGKKSTKEACFGVALVVIAGLSFTLANVIQKLIDPQLNFWHLLFFRAVAQTVVMAADVARKRMRIWPALSALDRLKLVGQGVLGGCLLLCIFIAIKNVPLGNASAIMFTTPFWTFLFAVCMLGEPMLIYRVSISAAMVAGVVFITRPPFVFPPDAPAVPVHADNCTLPANSTLTSHHALLAGPYFIPSPASWDATACPPSGDNDPGRAAAKVDDLASFYNFIGYACCIGVPLLSAVVSILTRQLRHVPAPVLMFWFALGSLVVGTVGLVLQPAPLKLLHLRVIDYAYTTAIVAIGMMGNLFYTVAVKYVSPSKANVFRSFEVILNFGIQVKYEGTVVHFSSVAGIALLLVAVLMTGFEGDVMKSRLKKWFRWL